MINVLHTEASLGLGGQERRSLREMTLLDRTAFHPRYLCQPGARSGDVAESSGIETHRLRMRSIVDPVALFRLIRDLRRWRIDVIHTHSARDAWLAGAAGRLTGIPVVRTRHLRTRIGGPFVYHRLASRVLAVSQDVADYLIGEGVPASQVQSIPTGIDLQRFDPARTDLGDIRAELGIPPEATLIGMIAVLRRRKGHRFLIEAFSRLAEVYPEARLLIVGDGPQFANIKAQVSELGLQDKILLTGTRNDVPDILAALDIFALPSEEEALGTALLEAMAMQVAVAATDVGGIPEAVGDAGLLFAASDTDPVERSLRSLLDDAALRQGFADKGRQRVLTHFDQNLMVRRIENVYRELRGAKP
ncbi:MAG: glycosyltransferase [Gammaproteobacteria bacterium]|nr:glycosyltransferase [Gammaproteobacteria bacterium]MCP5137516.1 glycosyltransferase [Gammaproteobacteria bacterium]